MALTINTNTTSLFAQQQLTQNQKGLAQTLTRLSSGLRVNSAKDDPAGLAISQTLTQNINGLNQGSRNGNDGISLVQTAQGALTQVLGSLQRMRTLSIQAANETYGSTDLNNLDAEYQKLTTEIDRLTQVTTFNGINLLGGGSLAIQIGANNTTNDAITISLTATSVGSAGLNITGTSVTSRANALAAMGTITSAIQSITTGLAAIGANQSNLETAITSNNTFSINLQNARSAIMDADMAEESANLAKFNILNQSNVAMLAQANSAPQLALQLLRG
jgi:flagellin